MSKADHILDGLFEAIRPDFHEEVVLALKLKPPLTTAKYTATVSANVEATREEAGDVDDEGQGYVESNLIANVSNRDETNVEIVISSANGSRVFHMANEQDNEGWGRLAKTLGDQADDFFSTLDKTLDEKIKDSFLDGYDEGDTEPA